MDIDENEEFERMSLLKQRETLMRGMGKNTITKQESYFEKKLFSYILI